MKNLPPAVRKALNGHKRHKYGAKKTVCLYKHEHDSQKEALWCLKLHERQKEGKIRNLILEPIYDIRVNGVVVCTHMPDFDYEELDCPRGEWKVKVMDVKGMKLPLWRLKHKLFCAIYPQIEYVVV